MSTTNILLTEEQRELAQMAAKIVKAELAPRVAELDQSGEFPLDVMESLRGAGFYGMGIPEKYGGLGLDLTTQMAIYEEIAKVDAGFSFNFALASGEFAMLEEAGVSEEMKQYYADKILNGSICSFCLTEAQAGSDAAAICTTAVRDGDEYVLNGTKCFITNGALADLFLVFAYTDKSKGAKGISAFLVEKDRGVQIGKTENKMGLKLSITSEVILQDVRIPADHLIGQEGKGFGYAMRALEKARVTTDAVQVLGGYGYMKEYPVEKLMRDAKVFSIFEGTNQINLMVSSGMLARQKSGQ